LLVTDLPGEKEATSAAALTMSSDRVVVLKGSSGWSTFEVDEKVTAAPEQLGPNDPAVLGYTSGTTGRSKGAVLTHGNFCSNAVAVTTAWGWTADDHLLLVLPLFHTHGLNVGLHGTLIQGSTITLERGFDAGGVLAHLATGNISMF